MNTPARYAVLLSLALVLLACVQTPATPPATPEANLFSVLAKVFLGQGGTMSPVPPGEVRPLSAGQAVNVDDTGRARLRFRNFLLVEVFRDTQLRLESMAAPDAPPAARLRLEGGTLFAEVDPSAELVTIESNVAVITALGTRFWVYVRPRDKMTWVLTKEGEVQLTAQGQTVVVRTNRQAWVLPGKAPHKPVPAVRMDQVNELVPPVKELTGGEFRDEQVFLSGPVEVAEVTTPPETPTPTPTVPPTPTATTIPTPTPTVTPMPTPQRIEFEPGATSAVREGDVPTQGWATYVVGALKGQLLIVTLSAARDDVFLGILTPDGSPLVRPTAETRHWMGILPVSGDYRIEVVAMREGAPFSLFVQVPAWLSFPAGSNTAIVKGQVRQGQMVDYLLRGKQGERVQVKVASPNQGVLLHIVALEAGQPILRYVAGESEWEDTLPFTDYYMISVFGGTPDRTTYTLAVTLTSPPGGILTPTPTATPPPAPAEAPVVRCTLPTDPALGTAQQEMGLGCPMEQARLVVAAWQPFEGGAMIWREDTREIYVLLRSYRPLSVSAFEAEPVGGTWLAYPDRWREGMPRFSCADAQERPYPVIHGFGYLWCNDPKVRDQLGAPLDKEMGDRRVLQTFVQGWAVHIGEWEDGVVVLMEDGRWAWVPREQGGGLGEAPE